MHETTADTRVVESIDRALSSDRRFSQVDAIAARNLARYRLGATVIAAHDGTPDADAATLRALVDLDDEALHRLLRDPVLHNALERELGRLATDTPLIGEFTSFLGAVELDPVPTTGPCESRVGFGRRPWPTVSDSWVWSGTAEPDEVIGGRLTDLYRDGLIDGTSPHPLPVTEEQVDALERSAELLLTLLPGMGSTVLRHVALVGFTRAEWGDEQLYSVSVGDMLPSSLFIAPEQLANPWTTAEILLHEGLHLTLFDVLRSGALLTDPNRSVPIAWRTESWTLVRVLFALHVYVHMLVFAKAVDEAPAELRSRYGPPPAADHGGPATPGSVAAVAGTHATSRERAVYLAEQLVEHANALTEEGRSFLRWLLGCLAPIDPELAAIVPHRAPPSGVPTLVPRGPMHRVQPVVTCPVSDEGVLAVMTTATERRVRWLNAHSWLLYALCDGRDRDDVAESYRRSAGERVPTDQVDARVDAGLAGLIDAGLVTTTP